MAQLAKIATGMSCFGQSQSGRIFLADGKTTMEDYTLREGMLVKDVINEICQLLEPPIVPVVRPFFALCELKTGHALCRTMRLSYTQAQRCYQLRVFINPGQNSICLKKYSGAAKNYYYTQLKNDFVNEKLRKRMGTMNIALQMAAIDMVLEAVCHQPKPLTTFEEVLEHYKVTTFLPAYIKDQPAWKETLSHLFEEFYGALKERDADVIKVQYVFAYEKDNGCGQHFFLAKVGLFNDRPLFDCRIQASWRSGIVMTTATKKETIHLHHLQSLDVRFDSGTVVINFVKDITGTPDEENIELISRTLHFKVFDELVSFCSVIDAYYRLKVDINRCVLRGDVIETDDYWREILGKDPKDLCHGPISQESANDVFSRYQNKEGYFLVRESRTKDLTFILSLCQKEGIFNYRISRDRDHRFALVDVTGVSPVPRTVNLCHTLNDLINHHHHFSDGLPILLKQNCPPVDTGPLPLFPDDIDPCIEEQSEIMKALIKAGVKRIDYRKELRIVTELGSGHFSSVHLAEWTEPGREMQKVAIKIPTFPQQTAKAYDVLEEMKREILTMYRLDHQYITKLLGVSDERHILDTIGRFPMVVMEFIDGGSLRGVLNEFRPPKNKPPPPNWVSRYLLYSKQISEGMDYLGSRNVVHRDLATRNVLVVSETHVKIADFGLARQFLDNKDYYKPSKRTDLPVYWYAPECLMEQKFSQASDVWSFGVTLWEIFTLGRRPQDFLEIVVSQAQARNQNPLFALTQYFKNNNRLPRLPVIPEAIYVRILKQTWPLAPERRPSFYDLTELITHELHSFGSP